MHYIVITKKYNIYKIIIYNYNIIIIIIIISYKKYNKNTFQRTLKLKNFRDDCILKSVKSFYKTLKNLK